MVRSPRTEQHHARPRLAGARILNVGCGGDTFGTQRLDFAPGSAATEVGSCIALPYRDGAFDEVWAGNVLEHMPNPLVFLQECRRVLKDGGRLVLRTDHAAYLGFRFLGMRFGDFHRWDGHGDDNHFMIFTVGHLQNLLRAAGFEEAQVTPYSEWQPGNLRGRLLAGLAPWLACSHLWAEGVRPAAARVSPAGPVATPVAAARPQRAASRTREAPLAR